jgi:hypothetical protein
MRSRFLLLIMAALPLCVPSAGIPAPANSGPPGAAAGAHRVVVDSISEYVLAVRPLAGKVPETTVANQHHATIKLRIVSPSAAAAAAVDGFVGDFTAETDRGQTLTIGDDGTAWNTGPPLLFAVAEEMDPRVRSFKRFRGRIRVYPRGQEARLRLPPQEGAEAHHPSGMSARLARFATDGGQTKVEIVIEWPEGVSIRDEGEERPFDLMGEVGGAGAPVPLISTQTKLPSAGGRKRLRIASQLAGLQSRLHSVIVRGFARSGTPTIYPFTISNLVLPYAMATRPEKHAAAPLETQLRVLVNDRPAGIGTLEVGVAPRRGDGWGPVRWERLTTDAEGRARFTFPAASRFRVLRRWRPSDSSYALALEKAVWQGADLDLTLSAGKPPRVAPLSAAGAPAPPAASAAHFETTARGYRVRALTVQESVPSAIVSYETDPTQVWLRASRLVRVTVEVMAPSPEARVALAWAAVIGAVGPDGRGAQPVPLDNEDPTDWESGSLFRMVATFGRVNPVWKSLVTLDGELSVYPRARLAAIEVPLAGLVEPGGAPVEVESEGVRLRAQRLGSPAVYSYRVEVTAPGDVILLPAPDAPPALLDAQRKPVAAPRGQARSLRSSADHPIGEAVTFVEPEGKPAFLRLPVVFRYGKPETRGFRLTDIPLPLAAGE